MRKLITLSIGLLLIMFYCSSCGVNYNLRRARYHIARAEAKGAKWSSDTLFKKLSFNVPGSKVQFIPKPIVYNQPMTFEKDSVITKVIIKKTPSGRDTVYVDTKCPDRIVYRDVPYKVENELSAEKSFWQKAGYFLMVFLIGLAVGYYLRSGPARNLTVNVSNKEKPLS
jgi:hypothetical protein